MSFEALGWAVKAPTEGPTERFVLIVLASFSDDSGLCWPKQETLQQYTQLSESSIRRALGALEKHGLIEKQHRYMTSGFKRRSDIYRLCIPVTVTAMNRSQRPDKNSQSKNHQREDISPKEDSTVSREDTVTATAKVVRLFP